jgi:NAD+ kinase
MIKKIGIVTKRRSPEAAEAVRDLIEKIDTKKYRIFIEKDTASMLKLKGYTRETICAKVDILIVFGGDGTLLSAARFVGKRGIPILGVNLGGLGFITEVPHNEFKEDVLNRVLSGRCKIEERIMLTATVQRKGKRVAQHTALNDIVINKSALARMAELDIMINKQDVTTFRADGLIVSTPTGSTAHSLSAGGPILYPTLESFVITPICPHTLTNRPIVLPDNFLIDVRIKSGKDVYLTTDGQVGFSLKVDDTVRIKKAEYKTKFITLYDRDYFKILRNKLKWGE